MLLLLIFGSISIQAQQFNFGNCSLVNSTQAQMNSSFFGYFRSLVQAPLANSSLQISNVNCSSSNTTRGCFNVQYRFTPCCSVSVNGTCYNTTTVCSYSLAGVCLDYSALATPLTSLSVTTLTTSLVTTKTSQTSVSSMATTLSMQTQIPTIAPAQLLQKILNPDSGKSPALQIVQQLNMSYLSAEYTPTGAKPYSYNGPLNLWVQMARPLREALMGNGVVNIFGTGGQFDIGTTAANSVSVLVAVSLTFVFALIGLIMAPCNIIGLYQKVKREKERKLREQMEADEMKEAENAAAKGLTARDLEKEKERKMREKRKLDALQGKDDKSEKIRIYSLQQRMNSVLFLLVVMSFNMACLIIASVATAQADGAFADFRNLALDSLSDLANVSTTLATRMTATYSPQRMNQFADAIDALPMEVFNQNVYPYVYPQTTLLLKTMNELKAQHLYYLGNASAASDLLVTVNAKQMELEDLYTTALSQNDINPVANQANCIINTGNLPVLSQQSPVAFNYADLPSFSANVAKVQDPDINSQFYAKIPDITQIITDMYNNANAPVLAKASDFIRNYGANYQVAGQVQYASLRQLFTNTTYVSKVALNTGAFYLGYRSNGAYVLIMLGFFASSASALLILFGRWQLVRLLNLAHWIVMAGFWIICGFSLFAAYMNGHFCNAGQEQFATWNPSFAAQAQDSNIPTYVSLMFNARAQCLANNSQPLLQLANRYSSAKYSQSLGVETLDATNISTFAETMKSQIPLINTQSLTASTTGAIETYFKAMIQLRPSFQGNNKVADASAAISATPTKQYINAGSLPLYNDPNAQNIAIAALNSYITNAQASYFSTPGSLTAAQCLTQFKSSSGGPSKLNSVRQKVIDLENVIKQNQQAITDAMNNMLAIGVAVSTLTSSLSTQFNDFMPANSQQQFTLYSSNASFTSIATVQAQFVPVAVRAAAQIQEPLSTLIDCRELGDKLSNAEAVCQAGLIGMDASYWAFGALAVLAFLQIRAFVLAAERLAEDSRWLIMAMLLRQNNKTAGATDRISRKPKNNVTGTTYLQEADFDMNFNDPSLAHTRV